MVEALIEQPSASILRNRNSLHRCQVQEDGQVPPCCRYALVYVNDVDGEDGMQSLVPMTKCVVSATIECAFAMLDFKLTFTNTTQSGVEASYEIPLQSDITIASLKAKIDGKEVEAIVKEKEQAKKKYDDAIAGGKVGFTAEKKTVERQQFMVLKIGNILPSKKCTVKVQVLKDLDISGAAYRLSIP